MKEKSMRMSLIGLSAVVLAAATPAVAADIGGGFSVSGGATIVSDYRFRGVSLSDEDPTLQGTLNLNHESGFYVGTWMSGLDNNPIYGDIEVDLYAGYGKEIAPGTTIDINATYYLYADGLKGADTDYVEFLGSVKHDFGPAALKVGGAWAPSSNATGNEDLLYGYGEISAPIPTTPITLRARLGVQDLGPASYTEWQVGAEATFGPVTAGLSYVDTDLGNFKNVDAGVVATLGVAF
jgi:uncharacterized protein (TIGR02001 family)